MSGTFLNNTDLRGMDLRGLCSWAPISVGRSQRSDFDGVRLVGSDLRDAILRGAMCRGTRFSTCQLDRADFRGADLSEAGLDGAESIKGADFSLTTGLGSQRDALLARPYEELDCWNPLTRKTTRDSLESLS